MITVTDQSVIIYILQSTTTVPANNSILSIQTNKIKNTNLPGQSGEILQKNK